AAAIAARATPDTPRRRLLALPWGWRHAVAVWALSARALRDCHEPRPRAGHRLGPGGGADPRSGHGRRRGRDAAWHLLLLGCFIGAGIGVTWPMTAKLADGQLPWNPDVASYVWALWWLAHSVAHLGNPFVTTYMAAPVGIQLGFDTLMPLPGLIMTPVTLIWGPTA